MENKEPKIDSELGLTVGFAVARALNIKPQDLANAIRDLMKDDKYVKETTLALVKIGLGEIEDKLKKSKK